MATTTITPNMSLIVPTPGTNGDPGPDYANNQNQDLLILDSHNHGPGSGVQITPTGLNINTNLTFQNHNLTNLYGVQFSAPLSSSLLTFLYTAPQSGGGVNDLFYNDGAGNVIALTKAGLVNATIASIPGESYSAGTFSWKQGAGSTIPANFDIGSITIRPNTAGTTNGVILGPPSSIASSYNIQLPILPSSTLPVQLDTSGNMTTGQITSAQITSAVTTSLVPTGSYLPYGGTTAPTGFLMCFGQAVSRTTFATLFSVLGTSNGIGDGTTTFNLPNFQGLFMRGVDNGAGNDPDTSSRSAVNGGNSGDLVGSTQADQYASHQHQQTATTTGGPATGISTNTNSNVVPTVAVTVANGGNETRPKNVYVNYIVKT